MTRSQKCSRPDSQFPRRNRASDGKRLSFEMLEVRHLLAGGTWQTLNATGSGPQGGEEMMLLSDGTAMIQGVAPGSGVTAAWYRLSPDSFGNYADGTWTPMAPMNVGRFDFPTAMLPDGRVLAVGGEYSTLGGDTNSAEIYDPVADTWTSVAADPTPQSEFGDNPIEVLPNGQVLAGYFYYGFTSNYDPATNSWTTTGTKLHNDAGAEETWVKLPDDSILSYDIQDYEGTNVFQAQRYVPSSGAWVDASLLDAADPPSILTSANQGYELGPGFLLSNGNVIMFGANGTTAYYDPTTDTWSAGPFEPQRLISGVETQLVATDDPGAVLPNGDVLIALSPLGALNSSGGYTFPGGTYIYEFDPTTGTFTDATPPPGPFGNIYNSYNSTMLLLPSGQVLLASDVDGTLDVYTPNGSPQAAWRPSVSNIANNGDGTYTLTGTQLNGISEGANYGDDREMASNYPIVQFTSLSTGQVYYGRTYDWSSVGVASGATPVSVQFTSPPSLPEGQYLLSVVANGIASTSVNVYAASGVVELLTVLNGNDNGPGSLRQAISNANGTPGATQTITFALPAGPQTINLLTPLPAANDPLTLSLDATQNVMIALSSASAWNNNNPLTVTGAGTLTLSGGIEGPGNLTVDAGSSLTANYIVQSALVIGGTEGSPATVTIAASDANGNPLNSAAASSISTAADATASSPQPAPTTAASVSALATTSTLTSTSVSSKPPISVAVPSSSRGSAGSTLAVNSNSSDLAGLIALQSSSKIVGVSDLVYSVSNESERSSLLTTTSVSSTFDAATLREPQPVIVANGTGDLLDRDAVAAAFADADVLEWAASTPASRPSAADADISLLSGDLLDAIGQHWLL
jgi:hypothetical protein